MAALPTSVLATAKSLLEGLESLELIDLNNDEWIDVLSLSDEIAWHRNINGKEFETTLLPRFERAIRPVIAISGDVDGDGDLDNISAWYEGEYRGDSIVWYENTDGRAVFADPKILTNSESEQFSTGVAADFDADGDVDFAFARTSHGIELYENRAGNFVRHSLRPRKETVVRVRRMHVADLSSDGRPDLVALGVVGLGGRELVAWYESTNDLSALSKPRFFDDQRDVVAADFIDIDGDDDVDAVFAYSTGIAWVENKNGVGTQWDAERFHGHPQAESSTRSPTLVAAQDLSGDGEFDVVSAYPVQRRPGPSRSSFVWLENDGSRSFAVAKRLTATMENTDFRGLEMVDIDRDGDNDIIAGWNYDGRLVWYENKIIGDANDDGVFDSTDLVEAFQTGEYEDGALNNSRFETGDWNGDGEFNSSDLVFAFEAGAYSGAATENTLIDLDPS